MGEISQWGPEAHSGGGPRGAEPPQHFHWQNFFHPQERGYRVRLRHISMGAHLRQYPYTALFQAYSDALLLSSAIKLPRLPAAAVACSRTPLIQLILGLPRFLGPEGSRGCKTATQNSRTRHAPKKTKGPHMVPNNSTEQNNTVPNV